MQPAYRGRGVGSFLIARMQELAPTRDGFQRLEVAPGGYNSDPVRVEAFYVRQGFRLEADDLYVWAPPIL